jgi:probable HAF family extracellular repeat protein
VLKICIKIYEKKGRKKVRNENIALVAVGILATVFSSKNVQAQMSITSLVDLGGSTSFALGISSDGSTVVGTSGGIAYKWQTSSGMGTSLGTIGPYGGSTNISSATAVSSDGSVVAGRSTAPVTLGSTRAFQWSSGTGMTNLGVLSGSHDSYAQGVSSDGTVVAGYADFSRFIGSTQYNYSRAFRWTSDSGMVDIGSLGSDYTRAYNVSLNGNVIVGESLKTTGDVHAFSWTQSGGMTDLGTLGGFASIAYGTSPDGSVIVGSSRYNTSNNNTHAFRWTASGGMQDLGGGSQSYAYGISADSNIIVGRNDSAAFIWDSTNGMRSLYSVLSTNGADLTGWANLNYATAISGDGSTVVGYGNYNGKTTAYIAKIGAFAIPEPTTLSLIALGNVFFLNKRLINRR